MSRGAWRSSSGAGPAAQVSARARLGSGRRLAWPAPSSGGRPTRLPGAGRGERRRLQPAHASARRRAAALACCGTHTAQEEQRPTRNQQAGLASARHLISHYWTTFKLDLVSHSSEYTYSLNQLPSEAFLSAHLENTHHAHPQVLVIIVSSFILKLASSYSRARVCQWRQMAS